MINLFSILVFISLYGVSIIGGKRGVIFISSDYYFISDI